MKTGERFASFRLFAVTSRYIVLGKELRLDLDLKKRPEGPGIVLNFRSNTSKICFTAGTYPVFNALPKQAKSL